MKTPRWIAAILLALVCSVLLAQTSPPMRVRGMIETFDGEVLSVKTRDGTSVTLRLADKAGVSGVVNASLADIVPDKYIGTPTLGERKVLVPEGTPIVTFVPADRSAIKLGAHCFIGATQRQPDGSLVVLRIAVGLNGVVPPM